MRHLKRPVPLTLIAAAVALCLVAASCGGDSSSSSSASSPPAAGFSKQAPAATFGEEASEEERAQASDTVERNMSARAVKAYDIQCETFAAPTLEDIVENGDAAASGKQGCAEALAAKTKDVPRPLLANSLVGPVEALRIDGDHGFALYHGTESLDRAMPMELEDGEWKVAAAQPEKLPMD